MSGAAPIDFTSPAWLTLVRHMLDVEVMNSELTPSEIRRFAQQFSHQNVVPCVLGILKDTISGLKFTDITCNSAFLDASNALLNTLDKAEKDFSRRVLHAAIKKAFGFSVAVTVKGSAVSDASSNAADLYLKTALLAVVGGNTGANWAEYYKSQSTLGSTSFKYDFDSSINVVNVNVFTVRDSTSGEVVTISNPVKDIASAVASMVKSSITNAPKGVVIPGLVSSDIPSGLMTMSEAIRFVLDASAISGVTQESVTEDILKEAYALANGSKSLSDVTKIKLASNAYISKSVIYQSGLYTSDILNLSTLNEVWEYMPAVEAADRLKKPSSSGSVEFYTLPVSKLVKFFAEIGYTSQQIVTLISGVSNTTNDTVFALLDAADRYTIADASATGVATSDLANAAGVTKGFAAKATGSQPVASTASVNVLHYLDFFLHNGGKSLDTVDEIYNFITNFGLEKPTAADINAKGRWTKFKATYAVPRNDNTTDINVIYAALSKVALSVSPSATDASSISQWFPNAPTVSVAVAGVTFSPLSSSNKALVDLAYELKSTISIIENPNNYKIVNLLVKLGTESVYGSIPKLYGRYSNIFALTTTAPKGVLGTDFLKGVTGDTKTKQASYNWAKTLTMDPVTLVRLGVSMLYGTVNTLTNLLKLTDGTNFTLADIVRLQKMPSTIDSSNTNLFSHSGIGTYLFSTDSSMADAAQHSKNDLLGTIFTLIINECGASNNVDIGAKLVNGIVSILGKEAYEDFAFTAGKANDGTVQTGMVKIEEFALELGDYQNCCRFGDGEALTTAVLTHMGSKLASGSSLLSTAYCYLLPSDSQMISGYVSILNRILTKELNVKYNEKRQTLPKMITKSLVEQNFNKKYAMIVLVELLAGPDKRLTKKEYDMLIELGVNPETIKQCCYAEVNVIGWSIQYEPGSNVKRMTYIGVDSEGGLLFAPEA